MQITTKTNTTRNIETIDTILDREWLKSTFILADRDIVSGDEYKKWIRKNRYFSTADYKFTSTAPGMNMACNPKPQFTRYCDIRSKGKITAREDITLETRGNKYGLGMGRYYSEAIDDNQQRIFLRFGVPKYMPLLLWIYKSFDIDKVILQNRGVITKTLIEAVGVVSKFFAIATAPLLALGMFAANVIVQNSRFYSIKDTMYVYWATVENILNAMVARRTMMPYVLQDYTYKLDNTLNREQRPTDKFISDLNDLIPNVIDPTTGRISVFSLALRSQAAFNKMKKEDMERNKNVSLATDFTGYQETGNTSHDTYFTNRQGEESLFTKFLFRKAYDLLIKDDNEQNFTVDNADKKSIMEFDPSYTDKDGNFIDLNIDPNNPNDSIEKRIVDNVQAKQDKWNNYREYLLAELTEGAAFAVFNVENTGSVGESFSNSFTRNPMESVFNSLSTKSRNVTDLLSSATDIPIVGDVMKLAADTGAKILSSASFGVANPLLALAYGVNITMPKIWESSAASLPRANYKIKLISPYGNAYSQLFNIYLPLAMILAGSLPRSTGASSYTHPFFCQLFDRGRVNIQLGMIESVSITRGTSNLAFSRGGHPNAIDIDISIANLDEIISVDVSDAGVIGKISEALDPDFSDKPFTTYLNTIMGVDAYTQIYGIPMLRLKLAERIANIKAVTNPDPSAFAAFTVNTVPFGNITRTILGDNQAALQDLINR